LVILLVPHYEVDGNFRLSDVVEDALGINLSGKKDSRIPTGFKQARDIAERLKLACGEVERATQDLARDPDLSSDLRSLDALDLALGDLRTVRTAEDELRQHLRG